MAYTEVTMIIAGALSEIEFFEPDSKRLKKWLEEAQQDFTGGTVPVEIYTLYHGHEDDGEDCQCIQYLTDHRPFWTNNKEASTDGG